MTSRSRLERAAIAKSAANASRAQPQRHCSSGAARFPELVCLSQIGIFGPRRAAGSERI
jgi:hypothetical protein